MTTRKTVREAVYDLMRAFDLREVFGNPGSTELPMFRNFPDDFRYVLGLQESIVVSMADGYAAARKRAAFVNLHSAIGVGHAVGAIFTAFKNQSPLVITAGQQARSMLPFEPFLYSEQAPQLPKPYIKWSCEPARAEDVPLAIARAYYVSMQPPRGPTLVSVPVDDWDRLCDPVLPRRVSAANSGDPVELEMAAAKLNAARAPVLVVGAGVARDGAFAHTVALAERHEARVWVSPLSARNSFPENHRLFAGFLPASRSRIVTCLDGADLVVALGAPVFNYHVESDGPHVPPGTEVLQLSDDPALAAWAPVGHAITTNLRLGIEALLAHSNPVPRPPARGRTAPPDVPRDRLTDRYLMQRIAALRPAGSIVVEEAPGSRTAMHDHLPMTEADSFFTCASGGLGHGLPAAVGVAMARPDVRTIALLGDGSSMYSIQGLWTAAQSRLPLTVIIVRNGSYDALTEFGRHFDLAPLPGLELPQMDFVALAQGHGVAALRVDSVAELDNALRDAFVADGPILVEVAVDRH